MAEERIFVAELTGVQYTCGIGGICSGKCEESGKCDKGISRQEAVYKMGRAIYLILHPEDSYAIATLMNNVVNDYRKMAEAALNALLEGK